MATDARGWLDNFHVFWKEGEDGPQWVPDSYRLKVLDGGVLLLQEKGTDMFHYYPPHTYTRIRAVGRVD